MVETKSGRYWDDITSTDKGIAKFNSDMGQKDTGTGALSST
ncbi:hypothetical protein ACFSCX_16255 [Bacillus salitolerans]|uniref:Uncharacterized protein n=1 Tax=Bacillus salitolerans TaxID=1437434 RepID=A0ABW4LVD2_9BACI